MRPILGRNLYIFPRTLCLTMHFLSATMLEVEQHSVEFIRVVTRPLLRMVADVDVLNVFFFSFW